MKCLWILLSFTQTVNVNNFYSSNPGENVWPNKYVFNHKLFDLYNMSGHNRELFVVNANLKIYRDISPFTDLRLSTFSNTQNLELQHYACYSLLKILSLIYNHLLLFIGKLKFCFYVNLLT